MMISFHHLQDIHFSLLLKWLESHHVKEWWDSDVIWSLELIQKKYLPRIANSSRLGSIKCYIIIRDKIPIGFIQLYPISIKQAGIDFYIGDVDYLNKGIGTQVLNMFIISHCTDYEFIVVDPDPRNMAAIKTYKKVGFQPSSSKSTYTLKLSC